LLISRLEKLEAMELAKPVEPGVWDLSPNLKPILTQLGERIDTLNLMRDALGEAAAHRSVANYVVHRDVPRLPVTGHVVGEGLAGDGLGPPRRPLASTQGWAISIGSGSQICMLR
jgi:hypothetical protein